MGNVQRTRWIYADELDLNPVAVSNVDRAIGRTLLEYEVDLAVLSTTG